MTRIKICGLTREEDIEEVNVLMPDYIGFVFWPHSKRALTDDQAKALKNKLNPAITAVGVFVGDDISHIVKLLETKTVDAVQLHGSEDREYINTLKDMADCHVIKAIRISDTVPVDIKASGADAILLDAGMGEGRRFDWDMIKRSGLDTSSVFLAGGLDAQNVTEAVRMIHPFAVDVSSGVETDHIKDAVKMEAFVRAVRSADAGGGL